MTTSRILIVEDELILADDMAQLLKSWGHEVVSIVASGEEAIKKADETSPDLVLMDIMLAGQMDGIEAAGWIRSQIEAAIVYLSAHSKKDLFERAKVTEPFAYLSKPVSPQELEGAVEMALYKHKMEKQLRENEEKFRAVFENSFDGMFLTEADGQVLEVNSAAAKMLGRTKDELHQIGRSGFVDATDPRLAAALEEREKTGRFMGELYFRRKDGASFPVEVSSAVFLDSKGQKKACEVIRDITERKLAEEALHESQEKYRMVVENANEAIVVAQEGIARFTNRMAQELVGYPEDFIKSKPFLDFIHPDDREFVEQRYRMRLRGEPVPPSSCFRVVHRDGTVKWVELSGVLIQWEGGPATLYFLSDITERRKIREELTRLDKLQSVGMLAGGIAHDFNNILAAILGNISLAKVYSAPGDKIYERLSEAEKSCLQAQGLTQQLLTFSSGGAPVKKVAEISRLVKEGCLGALWGSNVRCDFVFPDNLRYVEVDEGQISQVFGNLVLNALQAMPDGGDICVKACNATVARDDGLPLATGEYVKISLIDRGMGIREEHIKNIFDPYFTTKNKGGGLGLTTAYAIIKRHGGLITVTSQLNVGTTFHVYIPATEKQIQTQRDLDDPPAFGKGRVLVMDDEEAIRNLAKELLSFLGYDVTVAEDGDEAISLYAEAKGSSQPFDVVILDLTVPAGIGGIDVLNALRKHDPDVKAIVSSGYSSDPVMADYKNRGFRGVVAKPYTVKQLSEALKMVLQGDRR